MGKLIVHISATLYVQFILVKALLADDARYLNPLGPTHTRHTISCLTKAAFNNFFYINRFGDRSEDVEKSLQLSIFTSLDMKSPAYDVQREVIKQINTFQRWPIEITESRRIEFKNYEICERRCNKKRKKHIRKMFIPKYKSYYNIFIVDSLERLQTKVTLMSNLTVFHPKSYNLIYVSIRVNNPLKLAKLISKQFEKVHAYAVVIYVQSMKQTYSANIYSSQFSNNSTKEYCYGRFSLVKIAACNEGTYEELIPLLRPDKLNNFGNCKLPVQSMKYEPYIINHDDGFEIDILEVIGEARKIHFVMNISEDAVEWGSKSSGPLNMVYDYSYLGIGNIGETVRLMTDFDFTISHYRENMVMIVPIASYIPKWRVLTVIFTFEIWLICLGTLILVSILSYLAAKNSKELEPLKSYVSNIFLAVQISVFTPVPKQPVSDLTRLVFISFTIFSLIICSTYTSYLIKYLADPVRNPEIETLEDILYAKLGVGGMEVYREIFNVSHDKVAKEIFEMYELYERVNDTAYKWLLTVSNDRDTCTVLSRFYVEYLISIKDPVAADRYGIPKVHIQKNKLYSYPLSIIMRKGHFFRNNFNIVIERMVRAGIVDYLASVYARNFRRGIPRDSEKNEKLTPHHLQGAFALLIIGYCFSFVVCILEIIVQSIQKRKHAKEAIKTKRPQRNNYKLKEVVQVKPLQKNKKVETLKRRRV